MFFAGYEWFNGMNCELEFDGNLMVIYGGWLCFNGDFIGFDGVLLGFNGDSMRLAGDLMEFCGIYKMLDLDFMWY